MNHDKKNVVLGLALCLGVGALLLNDKGAEASIQSKGIKQPKTVLDLLINQYADDHNINRCFAHAVFKVESGKLHTKKGKLVKSKAGAVGVGQVMKSTADELCPNLDIKKPADNAKCAMIILDHKLKEIEKSLMQGKKLKTNDNGIRRYNGFSKEQENVLYTAKVINEAARCSELE